MIKSATSVLMIAAATTLMQWHGIVFWAGFVGATGWAWSLTLEAAALWLWWHGRSRVIAFAASCLLLAGPLYHVMAPVFVDSQQAAINEQVRQQNATVLRQQIATLEQALNVALNNSAERQGWIGEIQEARQGITIAQSELMRLEAAQRPQDAIGPWVKSIMQALALLVVFCASIMALVSIAPRPCRQPATTEPAPRRKRATKAAAQPDDPRHSLATAIIAKLDDVLTTTKQSQNEWAEANSIGRKKLSSIRNHHKLVESGGDLASLKAMEEVAGVLGIMDGLRAEASL